MSMKELFDTPAFKALLEQIEEKKAEIVESLTMKTDPTELYRLQGEYANMQWIKEQLTEDTDEEKPEDVPDQY